MIQQSEVRGSENLFGNQPSWLRLSETASRGPLPDRPAGPRTRHDAVSDDERPVLQNMGHPGGMDAGIVAAVGVQHGPLVEGHEIRVKSGQGDALVRQPDLAGRLAKSSCGWPLPATARPVRARTSPEYGDRSHRGGGHAVQPEFFGGHALHGFAVGGFAGKQRTFGMAVPVDEAGAEDAALQIDRVPGEWLGRAGGCPTARRNARRRRP